MIKRFTLLVVSVFLVLVILVQFPSLFIAEQLSYKPFKIYSNTSIKLDENLTIILDSVIVNLNESEFSEQSDQYKLYFIRGTFYEKLLRLFGRKNMAFSKFDTHIYSANPNFKKGILSRNNNKYERLNLVQIISHEAVHTQMYKDYYAWFKMTTPFWINEGYAEYISYKPIRALGNYELGSLLNSLENNADDWLETEYNTMTPRSYVKSRLLIEYLIDFKKMGIKDIIEDKSLSPDEIYIEIKDFTSSKK